MNTICVDYCVPMYHMNKKAFELSIFDHVEKYCIIVYKIIQDTNDLNIATVRTMIKRPSIDNSPITYINKVIHFFSFHSAPICARLNHSGVEHVLFEHEYVHFFEVHLQSQGSD